MTYEDKTLYDWLKFLNPKDPVLTAKFTDEEFENVCFLLRRWDSDRLSAKFLEDLETNPDKYL